MRALLVGYRIATYSDRSRHAWKAALDAADLDDRERAVVAEYLNARWASRPYDPDEFAPRPVYGKGAPVRGVFSTREA